MKRIILAFSMLLYSLANVAQEQMVDSLQESHPILSPLTTPYRYEMGWTHAGYLGSIGGWPLHEGLNASVDAGVSVGFGKHNPWRGAAFFSNLAGLYFHQVNNRLSVAGGLYLSHLNGWNTSYNQLGLFGLVNYQINNRLDITGYLSHDFGNLGDDKQSATRPMLWPGYGKPSTTIGADLGVKINDSMKVGIGVSITHEDGTTFSAPTGLGLTHHQMEEMHRPLEK